MPFWNKKKKEQKEEKKEPVKQEPTATEKCCMDPKYFQNLTDVQ
jgi:hypothetical protein